MRWLHGLRWVLTLRCRDAAHLLSHAMDRELSPLDRTALRLHVLICASCRRYRAQLALLRRVLALLSADAAPASATTPLSQEARQRIGANLRRQSALE